MVMKRLPLILSILALIAVAVLYILHFTGAIKQTTEERADLSEMMNIPAVESPLVYINIDSLLSDYEYYEELQDQLTGRQQELEAELNSQSSLFEKGAADFQNKVQKGLVTRREAAEMEQQLLQEQQNLIQLRDNLSRQLAEEEQVMNRKLINNIMEFLEEYNKDKGYQYIFSNSFGDNILFANESLDITRDVTHKLNEHYRKQQEKEK